MTATGAEWTATQRRWASGRRRLVLASAFLAYLTAVVPSIGDHASGAKAAAGYVILAAFAATYLLTIGQTRAAARRLWSGWTVMLALVIAEMAIVRADAFFMCVYLTVIAVGRLGARGLPIVAGFTLAAFLVPVVVWGDGIGTAVDNASGLAIPVVALVTYGMLEVLDGNRALADARAELARLTAENERARIARDLHDLLGHSLTTITVKAGLARTLGEHDPERALAEIAEVETLARRSLSEVRAAVSGYREVSLAGELASGREVLRAAGIDAELPSAVDVVAPEYQEAFGWVVREGLTNVVRHAGARTCVVRLTARSVEVLDDGAGSAETETAGGNGLRGLRERLDGVGGRLESGPRAPRGWRLYASAGEAR